MRKRTDSLVQIALALVLLGGVGCLIWTTARGHLAWRTSAAYSIVALGFGALLFFCWPPRKKRKPLFYALLAVVWASLGAVSWSERGDSVGATLGGLLFTMNLFISWSEWKSSKKIPSSSALPDDEAIKSAP